MAHQEDIYNLPSPSGHIFGVQGFTYGVAVPKCITFFLDNTAKVCDQHGRPMRGTMVDNKKVEFAQGPPQADDKPGARSHLATHKQVIAALLYEKVDWQTLEMAGWPQLTYDELKEMKKFPAWPFDSTHSVREQRQCYCLFCCIKDKGAREAALRYKLDQDRVIQQQIEAAEKINEQLQGK